MKEHSLSDKDNEEIDRLAQNYRDAHLAEETGDFEGVAALDRQSRLLIDQSRRRREVPNKKSGR